MLGKYLGLLITLLVIMASMSVLFFLSVWVTPTVFDPAFIKSLYTAGCEMVVVTAVVMLFSAFTTPVLTSLFTLGVFLAGHTLGDLQSFAAMSGNQGTVWAIDVVRWILPDLELFNIRNAAVHGLPIHSAHLIWAGVYALLYSTVCLVVASWVFSRRDFK